MSTTKVEWITHKGKKILFSDYSNVKSQEEMHTIMNESLKIVNETPGKVSSLVDMTNASVGPDFMKAAKEEGKKFLHKRDKSALLGITGLKAMLLKGYNLFSGDSAKPFGTKEEALDYLCS